MSLTFQGSSSNPLGAPPAQEKVVSTWEKLRPSTNTALRCETMKAVSSAPVAVCSVLKKSALSAVCRHSSAMPLMTW